MANGALHHIEIYVADLKGSTSFWGWFLEYLGYKLYQEWPGGRSWKLDKTYIVFVQVDEKHLDQPYHRCKAGLNHLAFCLEDHKAVDQLTLELQKREVNILYQDKHPYAGGPDHYAVYFEDPDRMKVEVVAD